MAEVPTTLVPDGRSRPPHLRSWRDGWRHLRFLLLYCPRWLFLYPGIALVVLGMVLLAALMPGPLRIGSVGFDVNTLLFGAMAILIGFQSLVFATFTKVFAISEGLLPEDERLTAEMFPLSDFGSGARCRRSADSCRRGAWAIGLEYWRSYRFGALDPEIGLRIVIPRNGVFHAGLSDYSVEFFSQRFGVDPAMKNADGLFDEYAKNYEQALAKAISSSGKGANILPRGAWRGGALPAGIEAEQPSKPARRSEGAEGTAVAFPDAN